MAENLLNTEYLRSEIKRQFGTQSAFARHLGWSRQYLSQVLNGKVNVTLAQLTLLSNSLGMPPSRIISHSESRALKETAANYTVDYNANPPTQSVSVVVANQPVSSAPIIEIASLRRLTSDNRVELYSGSSKERLEIIRSLQDKYRDLLPSTELIHQYKQEEKDLEERQNALRA